MAKKRPAAVAAKSTGRRLLDSQSEDDAGEVGLLKDDDHNQLKMCEQIYVLYNFAFSKY